MTRGLYMKKPFVLILSLSLATATLTTGLISTTTAEVHAATVKQLSKAQTITLLKNGKKAINNVFSKALDTPLTKQQIQSIMSPYFTSTYIEKFIKAELIPKENKWTSVERGTIYVYMFSYNSNFKISYSKDRSKIYTSEKYYSDYEGDYITEKVTIIKTKSGWRINDFDSTAQYVL